MSLRLVVSSAIAGILAAGENPSVTVYQDADHPLDTSTRELLRECGAEEISRKDAKDAEAAVAEAAGGAPLPWAFACGRFVGGADAVRELSAQGSLRELLACEPTLDTGAKDANGAAEPSGQAIVKVARTGKLIFYRDLQVCECTEIIVRVERMLKTSTVPFETRDVAQADGDVLKRAGSDALPWFFACGVYVGGAEVVKALLESGDLVNLAHCQIGDGSSWWIGTPEAPWPTTHLDQWDQNHDGIVDSTGLKVGDLNGDGVVDHLDEQMCRSPMLLDQEDGDGDGIVDSTGLKVGDLNGDGKVDVLDESIRRLSMQLDQVDLDGDGIVDSTGLPVGDFNCEGVVDSNDEPKGEPIELVFGNAPFDEIDQEIFTTELLAGFKTLGASDAILAKLLVQLHAGSVVAMVFGPASALAALRKLELSRIIVIGYGVTKVDGQALVPGAKLRAPPKTPLELPPSSFATGEPLPPNPGVPCVANCVPRDYEELLQPEPLALPGATEGPGVDEGEALAAPAAPTPPAPKPRSLFEPHTFGESSLPKAPTLPKAPKTPVAPTLPAHNHPIKPPARR